MLGKHLLTNITQRTICSDLKGKGVKSTKYFTRRMGLPFAHCDRLAKQNTQRTGILQPATLPLLILTRRADSHHCLMNASFLFELMLFSIGKL